MKFTQVITLILLISIFSFGLPVSQQTLANVPAMNEYIKVEVRGKLNNEVMAIGGETTGAAITANGVTWELDFSDSPNSQRESAAMNGKLVVVKGELSLKRGVEIRQRWIVKVDSIAAGNAKQDLPILDINHSNVKKLEVSQTFGGFRETQIFYTFPKQNLILKVRIDNKNEDFAVTGKVIVFPKSTTAEGLAKWLNNQHSDGLFPDIPQPVSTLDLPDQLCRSMNPEFTNKVESHLGNFSRYAIEFEIKDVEEIGGFAIKGFSGKAKVHLKNE
ncbi:MAG: hypothetical protein GY819_17105 [Planctomycetaceae bacterium]|nr:hypothetical protein [Planctomycetaceae bacterium]MDG1806426.1 hypothetical protein [Pirellulaceae bacterium]MDG2102614.1 hypothetical protein [Pirellulaceae bacterium]